MGLAVAAAARIISGKSMRTLSAEIASLALSFPLPPGNTHGQTVRRRFGISGAMENARAGYALLFEKWLPFYRNTSRTDNDRLRLLMKNNQRARRFNAIYRAGVQKLTRLPRKAASLS